ncbi:MAG TPA: HAD hydrolase-like protein [Bryobacteraceae bacterium]|nr:HAD hydrolase-like protein [Bryobacteraceae bacterium]
MFDADDTLWENNIYFEAAFEQFVEFLDHSTLSAEEIRNVLDEIELTNREIYGYGSINFGRNLMQCYQHLCERDISDEDLARVMSFAERILEQPIQLIDGVEETLRQLSERHELLLFTKGHPDEQKLKIDRSGLGRYFRHFAIVKEKDCESYRRLVCERGLDPDRCWMIGNSPRSDINPALEIGLGAVYIPHPRTWSLEEEEIRNGNGRLLILNSFKELCCYF